MFPPVNPNFRLSSALGTSFAQNGFVQLQSFFTRDFVGYIRSKIIDQMATLSEEQRGFSRIGYDLFRDDPVVTQLLSEPNFAQTLTGLTEHSLFFTQGVGFELERNKHHGFPWHIGTQSFGYQRSQDYGCSLWLPLDPIVDKEQGGGMSYVPEHFVSGQFMYDHVDPAIDHSLCKMDSRGGLTFQDFIELRHGVLNSPAMTTLFETLCRADDFAPGDALLFNKRVIHCSNPLRDGPLPSRAAFVMRFVDIDSRYDARRADGLELPRVLFGVPPQSNFHLEVCQQDGERISDSPYFAAPQRHRLHHPDRR
ncbi:MAG: phytanoyl-CoA dioxygenase family protein [Nannocystaceae bacterium]|nr:phytanoyl-CoA dioxygenase family protein [Nannocystaceae bacterium]